MDSGGSSGQETLLSQISVVPPKPERHRKKLKLDHKPPATTDIAKLRQQICDHKRKCQEELKEVYRDNLTELFYLQNGLNYMDVVNWKKKSNVHLQNHLKAYSLDTDFEDDDPNIVIKTEPISATAMHRASGDVKPELPQTPQQNKLPDEAIQSDSESRTPAESIMEQAKKEAQVMQRVAELRKKGLWSARRMPKVQEPVRNKAHWDYLLEEMQWLAADFAQERKWKKAGCRKISRMVNRYHQDRVDDEKKAEKEESGRLRRIAGQLAKQIKDFWSNIEKVVQYKQDSRLDEKRRQALDLHLNFIVDQTEKYSSWLSAGLTGTAADTSGSKVGSSSALSPRSSIAVEDVEFEPNASSGDDEETIAREEEQSATDQNDTDAEVAALQAESEMPIDQLLASLPKEVLDKPAPYDGVTSSDEDQDGEEFDSDDSEGVDDENTLDEQEEHEERDYDDELDDLKNEGEMTVEELAAKYAGAYASDFELPETPSSTEVEESDDGEDEDQETSSEEEQEEQDEEEETKASEAESEEVGMEYLLHPEKDEDEILSDQEGKTGHNKEITDIAAAAQSLQPTGYTLETTVVKTPIPFLLKHTLREYQHVGLDWLATMYEKKLNGILADEMGLGKTIQTISLLAHLACEHGIWGPHLIVVPTSVMLNWEMELKKWCPGFKILTYYGSQKERKLKRIGWSKTNAFHVCITSYKLVIQDHVPFKRKKWKYLILDEAQNIKNFKSQRWQTLLNFNSQRRLLLTGTPLQNNLMELWSLMHFLMPNVFQSHMEFKEWFSNPLTGMIEGTSEYNDKIIRRLHKVLRPFLLRRLKSDVEKQMPKKYEHVIMCRLSKRQRLLYEEFMSRRATKETLESGNFMNVINILMQLRKVCNHPDMFDPRPIISPFETESISVETASAVLKALDYDPLQIIKPESLHPNLANLELGLSAYAAHRSRKLQTPRRLIEVIDEEPDPPPRPPPTKLRPFVIRSPTPSQTRIASPASQVLKQASKTVSITSTVMKPTAKPGVLKPEVGVASQLSSLVSQGVANQRVPVTKTSTATSQPITLQIQQTPQGTRLMIPSSQLSQLQAGLVHIIQTSSGQHLITSAANVQSLTSSGTINTTVGMSRIVPISSVQSSGTMSLAARLSSTSAASPVATVDPVTGKPVLRTITVATPTAPGSLSTSQLQVQRTTTTTPTVTTLTSATQPIPAAVANGTTSVPKPAQSAVRLPATVAATTNKSKPSLLGPASRKRAIEAETRNKFEAELKMDLLNQRQVEWRKSTLGRLATFNRKHCNHRPVYGFDLHEAVDVWTRGLHAKPKTFSSNSVVHCYNAQRLSNPNHPRYYWNSTQYLQSMILNGEQRFSQLKDVLERFVFLTPPVTSHGVSLHASCHSNLLSFDSLVDHISKSQLKEMSAILHPIQTRMLVQFPEKRLIQYDCGKLQTLDILLRDLKSGSHRVLIFTQMTRMLDVLEAFLNYHGHRYLRLDGTTKVEARQHLMDRFNADKKIFVFILSTRSGGIGVNLTGADTVIFYDSDWNPTMDAQAQDRCHRIGQTRDVHIYRLVSEKTVEENILKKANQKRMLGDVAIEGGNFTTASLQKGTITDLFAEPSGLEELAESKREAKTSASTTSIAASSVAPNLNEKQFEQALLQAEDDEDVKAAAVASEEAGAELAEFDENIPWDEREAELRKQQGDEGSKVEKEIAMLEKELTAVERFAVRFLEQTDDQFSEEAVKQAELDIEQAKKDWELNRMKNQREEEERRAELEEDDMLYTYSKEDGMNQAFKDSITGENMPMWCPPTPPHSENDVYVDQSMCFLYDSAIMSEAQLPPVYVKKEKKRRPDPQHTGIPKKKSRMVMEDLPQPQQTLSNRTPRSLFDRPQLLKMRREKTLLRHPSMAGQLGIKMGVSGNLQKPSTSDNSHQDQPEWLIHEDWSLLQAVQTLLQLPLNLTVMSPAHIPNWDLVSDIVSTTSRIYRSPKQCRLRYENVIIPREEGKVILDTNPRKQQKKVPKSVYKQTKGSKPLRTGQLYTQDSGSSVTTLHAFRFDCIKNVASKRTPTLRPTLVNPTMRNPKHAAVIADSGIQYDSPMTPEEVAKIRQERIRNEKKQAAAEQQQRANQTAAARAASANTSHNTVQLQHLPVSGATAIISPATKSALQASGVSIARNAGSIVVNTPGTGSTTYSTLNKRQVQATSVISGATPVTQTLTTNTGRKMTLQEMQQSTTMQQFMRRVQGVQGQVGTPRTITVQQPVAMGVKSLTQSQLTQLNLLSQHQLRAKQATSGGTLVAQRATAGTTQLLASQTMQPTVVDASRVPTLVKTVSSGAGNTLPVSTGVNINVSMQQQQKALVQGGITKQGGQPQYRQIQLLHNKPGVRPLQKLTGITHSLGGKTSTGASVQIVQSKAGFAQHKIGVQQIQQLINKQQAQQQQAHIITAPGSSTAGQTIIATTQLITPANPNMHATITKMSTPHSGTTGAVSNVTVSLARPVITSSNTVALVSGAVSAASLVTHSPSKLVATSIARPASAITHRVAGAITGIVGNAGATGSTPVVSLASVTLQSQPSVSASLMNKALNQTTVQALQQAAAARNPVIGTSASAAGTTVLQQTILTHKPIPPATTVSAAAAATTTVIPVKTQPAVTTVPAVQSVQTISTTPAPTIVTQAESVPQPTAVGSTVTIATTPVAVVSAAPSATATITTDMPDSPGPEDLQSSTPDSTRTYAMRPRKTT